MTLLITIITLILGLISAFVAASKVQHKKETTSLKEEKVVKHRISRPKFTPILSNTEDAREKEVDRLLKKQNLSLAEMQYIYDFLMDTGKEKWRYIKGYNGYYRISTTGMIESCRYNRFMDPTLAKGKYVVGLSVDKGVKNISIHKVVAETFIPNPSGAVTVVPKDGDYRHCDVRNLMWKPRVISSKIADKMTIKEAA